MSKITLVKEEDLKPSTTRPLIVTLKSKDQLYSYYMPQLKNGGIFLPSSPGAPTPNQGSKINLLLSLPDETAKNTVTGTVVWVNWQPTAMGAQAGCGIHFDDTPSNKVLRDKIEKQLAGILGKSEQRTMTF